MDASVGFLNLEEGVGGECSSRSSSLLASSGSEAGTVCQLPGCGKPCFQDKDFCSRTHALEQMQLAAASLKHTRPVCRLPGCNRAAAVTARTYQKGHDSRFHDFCGWTHCKEWHESAPLSPPMAAQEAELVPQMFKDISPGQAKSLNRLLDALEISWPKDAAGKRMREELFASCGAVEFYKLHPWELLKDHQGPAPLYFFSFRAATACKGKTERGTKDQLAWRQSSSPAVSKDGILQKQSFSYKATISKTGHDSDLVKIFRAEEKLDQGTTGKRKRDVRWRYVMTEYSYKFLGRTLSSDSSESESKSEMLPVLHALRQRPQGFPDYPPTLGAAPVQIQEGQESSFKDLEVLFQDTLDDSHIQEGQESSFKDLDVSFLHMLDALPALPYDDELM